MQSNWTDLIKPTALDVTPGDEPLRQATSQNRLNEALVVRWVMPCVGSCCHRFAVPP